jgi:hypothetical protein
MYDRGYDAAVEVLRQYVARFANLQPCGRNGLHRYNNQDHSMVTAMLAVANLVDGAAHDVWAVNSEDVYLEQIAQDEADRVPAEPGAARTARDADNLEVSPA